MTGDEGADLDAALPEDRHPSGLSRAANALGGLRAAANMTPAERSERARKGALAVHAKRDAEREAAGLPPRKKRPPEPSAAELEPWLDEVDRRWPERQWPSGGRRRQAIILARMAVAEMVSEAMKRSGGTA
ncbi:hypothetical protein LQ938_11925 [Microbacterium sp. cx-55]|uniref:hypothetical protein n=1 Tax=Microbacterium sp. cx-55 TaxID=2875948 RepID=UPI001CBE25ED|nr:hypothetical protein [Microbacterium sp. cx-55]MBZ4488021.1 hypothetical protein [Microbacterium sp. cx-55]UGB34573.1 hypothetical protein LQ938_11925 [Microbacterium sp. cx-55]